MAFLIKLLFFYFIYSVIKSLLRAKFSINTNRNGYSAENHYNQSNNYGNQKPSKFKDDPDIIDAKFREIKPKK